MAELGRYWERESLGRRRYRHTQNLRPIAYLDSGSFKRIINDWQDGDPAWPHVVTRAPMLVYTAPDGMRRICPTREIDRYIEIGAPYVKVGGDWQKIDFAFQGREGNLLTWTRQQANMYVWMSGHFLKMGILLKGGYVPPDGQFAFPVGMQGLTRQGGMLYREGVPVMHVRPPRVYDYDNPEDNRPIGWEFDLDQGQWRVIFTLPDLSGMSRPLVDPQLVLQPDAAAGKDALVVSTSPTFNYGTLSRCLSSLITKGLIEFTGVSAIPASSTCDGATLYTYQAQTGFPGVWIVTVYSIATGNNGWPEGTKAAAIGGAGDSCWNFRDQGGAGTAWAGSAGLSTVGTDYEAVSMGSVTGNENDPNGTEYACALNTARVKGWFGASNTNHGMLCVPNAATGSWASSDHATPAWWPKLVIDYTLGGGASKSGILNTGLIHG